MKWRTGSPHVGEAGRAVREIALVLLLADREAEVRAVAQAVDALAALRREERDDVVAGGERGDAVADLLDDAGALVPEHGRRVPGRIGARGGAESVWQTPQATRRTSTSPARGSARSISRIASGAPNCSRTAALICIDAILDGHASRRYGLPTWVRWNCACSSGSGRSRPGPAADDRSDLRRSGGRRSRAASATSPPASSSRRPQLLHDRLGRAREQCRASPWLSAPPTRRSSTTALARSILRVLRRPGATACPTSCRHHCGARRADRRRPHKVFGNADLAIIPQTSTIASHLPRAFGVAFAIERREARCRIYMAVRRGRCLQLRRCVSTTRRRRRR